MYLAKALYKEHPLPIYQSVCSYTRGRFVVKHPRIMSPESTMLIDEKLLGNPAQAFCCLEQIASWPYLDVRMDIGLMDLRDLHYQAKIKNIGHQEILLLQGAKRLW